MKKQRIKKLILIYLTALTLGVAYYLLYSRLGIGLPCPVYELTGFRCPGCGNTRTMTSLISSGFSDTVICNRMFFPEMAYILWLVAGVSVGYVKNGTYSLPKPMAVHYVFIGVLAVWTLVRNIMGI